MSTAKEQVIATLKQARQVLVKDGWTKVFYTKDGAFCACGAVRKIVGEGGVVRTNVDKLPTYLPAWKALARALPAKFRKEGTDLESKVIKYNDAPGRTKAQVLALFTRAIRLVKEGK